MVIESPSFYSFQFKKEPGTRCLCGFPALFVDNVDNFPFCSEKWALFSKNVSILAPPLFVNSLNPLIFRGFPPFPGSFLVAPSFLILLTVILIEYMKNHQSNKKSCQNTFAFLKSFHSLIPSSLYFLHFWVPYIHLVVPNI